jgi:hypothetical protein
MTHVIHHHVEPMLNAKMAHALAYLNIKVMLIVVVALSVS